MTTELVTGTAPALALENGTEQVVIALMMKPAIAMVIAKMTALAIVLEAMAGQVVLVTLRQVAVARGLATQAEVAIVLKAILDRPVNVVPVENVAVMELVTATALARAILLVAGMAQIAVLTAIIFAVGMEPVLQKVTVFVLVIPTEFGAILAQIVQHIVVLLIIVVAMVNVQLPDARVVLVGMAQIV